MLDEACWRGGYGSVGFFLSGCAQLGPPPPPLPPPKTLKLLPPALCPAPVPLTSLGLAAMPPGGDWAVGIRKTWVMGEDGARAALHAFLDGGIDHFQARSKAETLQRTRYGCKQLNALSFYVHNDVCVFCVWSLSASCPCVEVEK